MAKSVMPPPKLILASASAARRAMLERAGVLFDAKPAKIDERAVQDVLMGDDSEVEPADIAELLAEAKARDVSERHPGALVIGSDQVLEFEDEILNKPADLAQARAALKLLRASTHQLHSGVAIALDGEVVWSLVDTASLTMRQFSDKFLAAYIAEEGEALCSSVGAYKLEGRGLQLFEHIDGDYFTILGMPLLPLLNELRARGAIAT
ncbi:MAG: Maf family protein [Hyphomicrobiaceae bacterium]